MSVLSALDRYWYAPAPSERLSLLRIAVGAFALVYMLARFPALTAVTRFHAGEFDPVGVVSLLGAPLPHALVYAPAVFAILTGVAFVLGFRYAIAGPLFALAFLWVTSYRSSWGMKFHTENLVALHLALLAVVPAADSLSFDALRRRARGIEPPSSPDGRYGWAIRAICVVTVAAYVLAGVAKLRLAGGEWLSGDTLRAQVAYDNLRKIELGSLYSPLGAALVAHAWPFQILAWATLALELGAPVALFGRGPARIWVAGVFLFHVGVVLLMAIAFPYQLSFVAYLSFFDLERAQKLRLYRKVSDFAERLAPKVHYRSMARD